MDRRSNRKFLFILILAGGGVIASAVIGAAMIYFGVIHYEWSERILRRRSLAAAAHKDVRILVLGDSFLTPWPVQHCLSKDLDTYCTERNIGLINTAVGGFGPYEYLDQLRSFGPQYRPNLVLLFNYAGNDLTDVLYRLDATPRQRDGMAPVVRLVSTPTAMLAPWELERTNRARTGGIFEWLDLASSARAEEPNNAFDWDKMLAHGIAPDLIEKAKNRIKNPNGIGADYVNPYLLVTAMLTPRYVLDNILMDSSEARGAWDRSVEVYRQIVALAKQDGTEVCVVVIPSTVQIDRSHFELYSKASFLTDNALLSSTEPQDRMKKFCKWAGIRCVDLLPAMSGASDTASLYWENDDHLSEMGHQLAFKSLREQFLDAWCKKNAPKSAK